MLKEGIMGVSMDKAEQIITLKLRLKTRATTTMKINK